MNSWDDPTEDDLMKGTEYEIFVEGMSTMVFSQPFVMKIRDTWQVDYQPGNIKAMATHVPTLMLNGAEDHVCLPGYVRKLSDSFENSYWVVSEANNTDTKPLSFYTGHGDALDKVFGQEEVQDHQGQAGDHSRC